MQGSLVVVHPDDHRAASPFRDRPGRAHGIAHVAADDPVEVRTVLQDLQGQVVGHVHGIHVVFRRDDLHIRVFGDGVLRAARPVLMAGRADVAHEDRHLSPVVQLLAERLRQVRAVLVVVRVADVGQPLAAFGGVGA